jgi:hypothetical protein
MVYFFTRGTYTHTSLAITPRTDEFYSYARRRLYNFLIAGMMKEDLHAFVFARFPESRCVLYEIDVTDEDYERIKAQIDFCMDNYGKATYSFIGAILTRLGIVWRRKYKFTCSQFVAECLDRTESITLPRNASLMRPHDFLELEGKRKIFEGKIKDCNFDGANKSNKE